MIECVGTEPNGVKEYLCAACNTDFLLRQGIEEDPEHDFEVFYCPFCGTAATNTIGAGA